MNLLDRRARLGLAFIAACVSSLALYAILRFVQSRLFAEPNPATIIWSAHAGYFWRCLTVAYAGSMLGFLAYGAAKRTPERVVRALLHALTVAVVLIVLQGVLLP
jgi:hypothetical protein